MVLKAPYFGRVSPSDSLFTTSYVNIRIGYVEIPLSLQYHVKKWYAGAGPSIGFKLFSKSRDSGYYYNYYKKLDIAANVLAGYKITKNLDVNVRYSYGLLNVLKDQSYYGNYYTKVTTTNRFANVSVLYSLP